MDGNLMVPKDCMLDFHEQKLFVDVVALHTQRACGCQHAWNCHQVIKNKNLSGEQMIASRCSEPLYKRGEAVFDHSHMVDGF